ncbi:MAG: alpha-amylase family glycosyl hydrolase [Sphingomonadales bacterium]
MTDWWRGATIYQIYPRSFQDSNGDGVGDLKGITQRLGHVAYLGADAVWVSPFFKSPMVDYGYDVEDYRQVDPVFGTLDDADEMIATAHRLGLKVIIDMVLSHTSNRHSWFQESRRDRDNAKANWYVWSDPKPDGSPPNNWLSIFGGIAWTWEPRRQQYYLHNFLTEQPDLNLYNPEVQDALLAECQFWLDRGVDGFRLDAVNFLTHDPELKDNPPRPAGHPDTDGVKPENPYNRQLHLYDKSQPETRRFLERLRNLAELYPDVLLLGVVACDNSIDRIAEYAGPGGPLHTGYSFALLKDDFDLSLMRENIDAFSADDSQGWPAWAFSNHDVERVASRWGGQSAPPEFIKSLIVLLLSLRGTVFLYQGEELGLPEVDIPYDLIVDPYGLNFWPEFRGRDGCRTPFPWTDADPRAGFTTVPPWLPIPNAHILKSVAAQENNPDSILSFTKAFLALRKEHPALRIGDMAFHEVGYRHICFSRQSGGQTIVVAQNFGPTETTLPAPFEDVEPLPFDGLTGALRSHVIHLPPHQSFLGRVRPFAKS